MRQIILDCDATDYADIQKEFALRQQCRDDRGTLVPDGDSNLSAAMVAEMVRDLEEYRSICGFVRPPRFEGLNRAGHVTNSDLLSRALWATLEAAVCDEMLRMVQACAPEKGLPANEWAEMFRRAAVRCAHGLTISVLDNKWRMGCVPHDCQEGK